MTRFFAIVGALFLGAMAQAETMLVFDGSNSMWGELDGAPKIDIAQDAVSTLLDEWTPGEPLGLVAYGHREARSCTDIEVLAKPGSTYGQIRRAVRGISPQGRTPLTGAVVSASRTLIMGDADDPTLVLLTDGVETCNQDPCEVARMLKKNRADFVAHVIGFDLLAVEQESVACLAQETGGSFIHASNARELNRAMMHVARVVAAQRQGVTPPRDAVTRTTPALALTAPQTDRTNQTDTRLDDPFAGTSLLDDPLIDDPFAADPQLSAPPAQDETALSGEDDAIFALLNSSLDELLAANGASGASGVVAEPAPTPSTSPIAADQVPTPTPAPQPASALPRETAQTIDTAQSLIASLSSSAGSIGANGLVIEERVRERVAQSLVSDFAAREPVSGTAIFAFGTAQVRFGISLAEGQDPSFSFRQPTWTIYDRVGQSKGQELARAQANRPVFEMAVGDYWAVLEADNVMFNYQFSVNSTLPSLHIVTLNLGELALSVQDGERVEVYAFRFEKGPENPSLDLVVEGPWSDVVLLPPGTYIVQGRTADRRTTVGPMILEAGDRISADIAIR